MTKAIPLHTILLILLSILSLTGLISAVYALACGLLYSWIAGHRLSANQESSSLITSKINSQNVQQWATFLLKLAIVIFGLTLPIDQLSDIAQQSFFPTLVVITLGLGLGLSLAKLLGLNKEQAWLISSGTAICGASAIAAVASSTKASHHNLVLSLAIIFILNALALFIFPMFGHWLDLSQQQFGLWAALAIHDTSSVVGAAASYGQQALDTATPIKLSRALWIIPVALLASIVTNIANNKTGLLQPKKSRISIKIPWFILIFILASGIGTLIDLKEVSAHIKSMSTQLFALSLLWIGASFNKQNIKSIPVKSFLLGALLWISVSGISLAMVIVWY